jgi:hypothetical protein
MKARVGMLLMLTAALLMAAFVPASHALTAIRLDRNSTGAALAPDTSGALTLQGLGGMTYAAGDSYAATGSIRNAMGSPVAISIAAHPVITVACKQGTKCPPANWTLSLCVSDALWPLGTINCTGSPQSSELSFSGQGPVDAGTRILTAASVVADQPLYLYARATADGNPNQHLFCAEVRFTLAAITENAAAYLTHSPITPRSFRIELGGACP